MPKTIQPQVRKFGKPKGDPNEPIACCLKKSTTTNALQNFAKMWTRGRCKSLCLIWRNLPCSVQLTLLSKFKGTGAQRAGFVQAYLAGDGVCRDSPPDSWMFPLRSHHVHAMSIPVSAHCPVLSQPQASSRS